MKLDFQGKQYELVYDSLDPYVVPGYRVCYCDSLARVFQPILYYPYKAGDSTIAPEYMAYRFVHDPQKNKLCIIYEVYWPKQDCNWRNMNKDHEFDYEPIQVHLDTTKKTVEKVVISTIGPPTALFHGVEVYIDIKKAFYEPKKFRTSSSSRFPWGGLLGKTRNTYVRNLPLDTLDFEKKRPVVSIINCFHAFIGSRGKRDLTGSPVFDLHLKRLNKELLEVWYNKNEANRYGRDISKPLQYPHMMYSPPPELKFSNFCYDVLIRIFLLRQFFTKLLKGKAIIEEIEKLSIND